MIKAYLSAAAQGEELGSRRHPSGLSGPEGFADLAASAGLTRPWSWMGLGPARPGCGPQGVTASSLSMGLFGGWGESGQVEFRTSGTFGHKLA